MSCEFLRIKNMIKNLFTITVFQYIKDLKKNVKDLILPYIIIYVELKINELTK